MKEGNMQEDKKRAEEARKRAAKKHREQAPEHEKLTARKAIVKRLVEEEFGRPLTPAEKHMKAVSRGETQLGPGLPLLPPAYRGSEDFYAAVRLHVVRHGKVLVAAFHRRDQAERWLAWFCAERDADFYEFVIEAVSLMHEPPGGALFPDFAPTPKGGVS